MSDMNHETRAVEEEEYFRFAAIEPGDHATNAADNERDATLAVCVALQQSAGFKSYIDLREVPCPHCKASGFNTGYGYFQFSCGLEMGHDGDETEPCSTALPAPPREG